MIRFIDLTTGKVFNGDVVYKDNGAIDTNSSYVHWFDNAQSSGMTYVQKVCILSDKRRIDVHIDIKKDDELNIGKPNSNNTIFKLVDINKITTSNTTYMNGIPYQDIKKLYTSDFVSYGGAYTSNYYVHMIYFVAESPVAIEAKEVFSVTEYKEIVTIENTIDPYTLESRDVENITFEPLSISNYIVGADFYDMREEMKIGVANFGLELPESVQKAIYESNVHEDAVDNILLNRKYKELLMNCIDILGNKGSYTSMSNALNWFEYPNILKIKEFWKHDEWGRTIYNDQEFTQRLTKAVKESLVNYAKTTYIGIYCALQQIVKDGDNVVYERERYPLSSWKHNVTQQLLNASLDKELANNGDGSGNIRQQVQVGIGETYINTNTGILVDKNNKIIVDKDGNVIVVSIDSSEGQSNTTSGANFTAIDSMYKNMERFIGEPVPELEMAVLRWSKLDMSIKMTLLGNFFETYFMPVHLDLIHSTIEDIVYTNAMKLVSTGQVNRVDDIIHNAQVKCNVKDGQIFMLGDVNVQANSHTAYVREYLGPSIAYGKNKYKIDQTKIESPTEQSFLINGNIFSVKDGDVYWKEAPIQIADKTVLYDDLKIEHDHSVKIDNKFELVFSGKDVFYKGKILGIDEKITYNSETLNPNIRLVVDNQDDDNFSPIIFEKFDDGIYYMGKVITVQDGVVTYDNHIVYPDKNKVIVVGEIKFLYQNDKILLGGYSISITNSDIYVENPLSVDYDMEYIIDDQIQSFKIGTDDQGNPCIIYSDKIISIKDGELTYNGAIVKFLDGKLILDNQSTEGDSMRLDFEDDEITWDGSSITIISGHSYPLPGYTGDTAITHSIIGVEEGFVEIPIENRCDLYKDPVDPVQEKLFDQEVKTILLNNYNGVGVVIPLEFKIPLNPGDVITKELLCIENDATKNWEPTLFTNMYAAVPTRGGYEAVINFNLLCTRDREYDLRIQFFCNSGQTYVKRVKFVTVDTRRALLDLYKVKSIRPAVSREANEYMFTHIYRSTEDAHGKSIYDKDPLYHQNNPNQLHSDLDDMHLYYTQYIPVNGSSDYNPDGVKLKMMIVMRENWYSDGKMFNINEVLGSDKTLFLNPSNDLSKNFSTDVFGNKPHTMSSAVNNFSLLREWDLDSTRASIAWAWLQKSFNIYSREVPSEYRERDNESGNQKYLIFIAKKFSTRDDSNYLEYIKKFATYYGCNNLVLRSDLVYLPQEHYLEKLDRRTLASLSVMPYETIAVVPNIKYLRYIDSYEWEFKNSSTLKTYHLPSIKEPFVVSNDSNYPYLEPGYYDITFRYKLSSETNHINEVCLKSAFIILPDEDDGSALYEQTKIKEKLNKTYTYDLLHKRSLYGDGDNISRSLISKALQKDIMENTGNDVTKIPELIK